MNNHDVLVIGASAGGVEAVTDLVHRLPRHLPAAVFVVVHLDPAARSQLAQIIGRPGGLQATTACHGDRVHHGHVWVAPPDHHLMLRPGHVDVVRGPRENGHRPSVDVLFRTAAAAYGSRVTGVVLTGYLDCGTAGLQSIKARGGLAVAQDPTDAVAPEMPQSAIQHVAIDHVAKLRDLPRLLTELVARPAGPEQQQVRQEVEQMEGDQLGSSDVEAVCPSCQGKMTVSDMGGHRMYRCHVGHAFSLQSLSMEQGEAVERALWASVRALEEAAGLASRVANMMSGAMRARFLDRERTQRANADVVRGVLLGGNPLSAEDALGISTARPAAAETNGHPPSRARSRPGPLRKRPRKPRGKEPEKKSVARRRS